MKKKFVGVRVQTCRDKDNYLKRLKHNTRNTKQQSVKNEDGIEVFKDGKWLNINHNKSEYSIEVVNQAKQDYDKYVEEQKQKNDSFHSKRTRSLAEGYSLLFRGYK